MLLRPVDSLARTATVTGRGVDVDERSERAAQIPRRFTVWFCLSWSSERLDHRGRSRTYIIASPRQSGNHRPSNYQPRTVSTGDQERSEPFCRSGDDPMAVSCEHGTSTSDVGRNDLCCRRDDVPTVYGPSNIADTGGFARSPLPQKAQRRTRNEAPLSCVFVFFVAILSSSSGSSAATFTTDRSTNRNRGVRRRPRNAFRTERPG